MGDIYTNPPQSRNEAILRATIDGTEYTDPPESRIEDLLLELKEAIEEGGGGGGTTVVPNPTGEPTDDLNTVKIGSTIYDIPEGTEVEANPTDSASDTLTKLRVNDTIYSVPSGGGGGGTSDYTELDNKPQINGTTLAGNKTSSDLGLVGAETGKGLSSNDYTNADKAIVDGVTAALADKVDKVAGKGLSTNDYTDADKAIVDGVTSALSGKVDKVQGKGLSTNDFTDAAKDKLDGIAAGAEVNVNADWSASSGDAQILNKPTLGTAAAKNATDTVTAGSSALVESGAVASAIETAVADKADKVSGAVSGNFASLTQNGDLDDSGKKAADFMPSDGVVANPTGTAAGTLTSLGINGDKYDIPSGGSSTLANLTDVNISSPSDGQILQYDAASQKWVNHVNAPEYITVNVDVYSAASDTLTYTDATGQKTVTTDASGHGTASIVCAKGQNITFTSSVAKNPSNLSAAYSKTINVNSSTTSVYVMPSDVCYWWGYKSSQYVVPSVDAGWSIAGGAFDPPTEQTNRVYTLSYNQHSGNEASLIGFNDIKTFNKICVILEGVTILGTSYGSVMLTNSKNVGNTAGDRIDKPMNNQAQSYYEFTGISDPKYITVGGYNGRANYIYAVWCE